jgi:hypothetical protein
MIKSKMRLRNNRKNLRLIYDSMRTLFRYAKSAGRERIPLDVCYPASRASLDVCHPTGRAATAILCSVMISQRF